MEKYWHDKTQTLVTKNYWVKLQIVLHASLQQCISEQVGKRVYEHFTQCNTIEDVKHLLIGCIKDVNTCI